ncbi:hypothetical protein C8J57DRAFT_1288171 [Mycena rebaudengoi]|nr:hypothetical protein C8J57DRAFT_1288171 [Mycena rebaudengoi]
MSCSGRNRPRTRTTISPRYRSASASQKQLFNRFDQMGFPWIGIRLGTRLRDAAAPRAAIHRAPHSHSLSLPQCTCYIRLRAPDARDLTPLGVVRVRLPSTFRFTLNCILSVLEYAGQRRCRCKCRTHLRRSKPPLRRSALQNLSTGEAHRNGLRSERVFKDAALYRELGYYFPT